MRLDCLSQNNACSSMNQPPWDFCSLDWYAIFPTNLELASFGSTPDRSVQHAHARCPVHHVAPPHPTQCVQHAHPLLLLWAHWPGPFFGGFSVFLKKLFLFIASLKIVRDIKTKFKFQKCSWFCKTFSNLKMFLNFKNIDEFKKKVCECKKCWWIQKKSSWIQNKIMNLKKGKWNQKMFMTFKKMSQNSKNIHEAQKYSWIWQMINNFKICLWI